MSVSPVVRVTVALRAMGAHILPHPASIDLACHGKPSARAMGAPAQASAPAASAPIRTSLMRRRKTRVESPDAKRADPAVGNEWFAAAT